MLNKSVLIGRLTKDIELKKTKSDKAVASVSLAVNRNFKNDQGEYDADFIPCVIWGSSAETLEQYAHKGSLISVEGHLQMRSYEDASQVKHYVMEVITEHFDLLESKKKEHSKEVEEREMNRERASQKTTKEAMEGILDTSF